MKINGKMGVVFWALVGLLAGTAFGMVWHLAELTLVSTAGLSGAAIFDLHDCVSNPPRPWSG